jgi:hypothetical protein
MIKWLLRDNPALLGDVLEERASGRAAAWVWWQIFVALARSMGSSARQHPVLALRGIAAGIVVYLVGMVIACAVFGAIWGQFYAVLGGPPPAFFPYPSGSPTSVIFILLIPWITTGWVVARTHRACAGAAILGVIALVRTPEPHWISMIYVAALVAGALLGARQREGSAQS